MFIPGCEGVESCIMRRGETKVVHIQFMPYRPVEAVTSIVHVEVGWFIFPVTLNEPNACLHSLPCPLAPYTNYEYVFNITIDESSRTFSGKIKWELTDEDGEDLACVEFAGGIS
ncbi:NPC intracellular cholesterol transporter 2 homolog a [Macrosteles quadrilineatus]|uniref:NPC intracellular cholesterol transporter 2 homolog a n=1 Tax=Macrosteles quadrilineatus TaxID=74068 RepID=UPI0023E2B6B7|nr:NPC intracellular cholesterol transporter 2 homolog a [Macrosteles quadrilineatus]